MFAGTDRDFVSYWAALQTFFCLIPMWPECTVVESMAVLDQACEPGNRESVAYIALMAFHSMLLEKGLEWPPCPPRHLIISLPNSIRAAYERNVMIRLEHKHARDLAN